MKSKQVNCEILDASRCIGCTACVRDCPTEALRVRDGKATTIPERCVDCGHCIRSCPYHAKGALTDPLDGDRLKEFQYTIAIVSPVLFSQFCPNINPDKILTSLRSLGFDEIFDESLGCEAMSVAIKELLQQPQRKKPLISSFCPALTRLIQLHYPGLVDNITPFPPPQEITARIARQQASQRLQITPENIGIFLITPCTAKVSFIRKPIGLAKSNLDGAISIVQIYGKLLQQMRTLQKEEHLFKASGAGLSWARTGGQTKSINPASYLVVDGMQNVVNLLEEIELGMFNHIDFIECALCTCGCVGGPLAITNPFVARIRVRELVNTLTPGLSAEHSELLNQARTLGYTRLEQPILPQQLMYLDKNIARAIQLASKSDEIYNQLPGLDCCSCGSPSCRALAEDVAKGEAELTDCIFKLMEGISTSAREILKLSKKINQVPNHFSGKEPKK